MLRKFRSGLNLVKNTLKRTAYTKTLDGNKALSIVSYALTDNIFLFPITPSTTVSEWVDVYEAQKVNNVFGDVVSVEMLQSESGVAGAIHGSASAGALTTTYTCSQGLVLMIPSMFRTAGECFPAIYHCAARALAKQAHSIFCDHTDVMSVRSTGMCMLSSSSVQECVDFGAMTHYITIESKLPWVHIYDGFRTSHEFQKVEIPSDEELKSLVDFEALTNLKKMALNPENPETRGASHGPPVYFQLAEIANKYYDVVPEMLKGVMKRYGDLTGRYYGLYEYTGSPTAENVIVVMCSGADTVKETVEYLNEKDDANLGVVNVRLFRPWSAKDFMSALPNTTKKIAVLDRTKEIGSFGEPLYLDVAATCAQENKSIEVIGGRFGIGGKEFTPSMVKAVFTNLEKEKPLNHFTVGINDDVTNLSLPVTEEINCIPEGTTQCIFWGMGGDGTIMANQRATEIIGENTDFNSQSYFSLDPKKSGSLTRSFLRFSKDPIVARYLIKNNADYVAVHHPSYVEKYENLVNPLKENGIFVLNSPWETLEELEQKIPKILRKKIAEKNLKFYNINASAIANECGLSGGGMDRINMIMQTVFFSLSQVLPMKESIALLKEAIIADYKAKNLHEENIAAVDKTLERLFEVEYPESWSDLKIEPKKKKFENFFHENVHDKMANLMGDSIPVSHMDDFVGGKMPAGTTKYDKRKVSMQVPSWNEDNCTQCGMCSFVCPHSVIRTFLVTDEELKQCPTDTFVTVDVCDRKIKKETDFKYRIQVSVLDCNSCTNCIKSCPSDALSYIPIDEAIDVRKEDENWNYAISLPENRVDNLINKFSVIGAQYKLPYLEFPGSCAGCAESAYTRILTQMFGDSMFAVNPAGCASVWTKATPSHPYGQDKEGRGPTYSCPLFENMAEFGFGALKAYQTQRGQLKRKVEDGINKNLISNELKELCDDWINVYDTQDAKIVGDKIKDVLKTTNCEEGDEIEYMKNHNNLFMKQSFWLMGGDGWSFDINFGGLIHVLSKGEDLNVFVFDTEVYSNTGGQASKATNVAATAKFASSGKKTPKMDLGSISMGLGNVYTASVSFANPKHLMKSIKEAEEFEGSSMIIAYCPCITHGIKDILEHAQEEQKLAVKSGYWPLYTYNPDKKEKPFKMISKKVDFDLLDELFEREGRYKVLERTYPEEAEVLQAKLKENIRERYEKLMLMDEK